jgi:kinesin family protein 1
MDFLDSVTEDGDEYRDDMEGGSPWKRPGSGMTWSTGETSVGDSTLTMSSPPEMEERVQAVVEEYEAKMKVQKERYENRVKQLKVSPTSPVDDGPMSLEEERLARGALVKWRRRRRVRIAEDLLTHAVTIKEANVVSAELNKGVVFQFLVVQADIPLSACESIGGLAELDDLSDVALSSSLKPCIGVKVLDRHNNVVSIWSLPKLQQRLQQMRNLYKFIDNPEYSQHFSWEDPFYESPPLPGNYSFVGTAQVSLALLSRNLPSSSTLQIGSPYTADPIGTCRVSIKPISVVNPTEPALPLGSHTPFVEGSELSFEIYVDKVDGLTKAEFTLVHLQLHLSSFFGPNPDSDELFSSDSIDLETTGTGELKIRCTLTIKLTPKIHQFLAESYGRIDFFARIKPAHLDKIERWDEARDASAKSKVANTPSLRGDPDVDVTRRPEDDLVSEQRHDVMASLEIRELDETGEYVAVPVVSHNALDAGAFFLRQGLQRRVVLHLSHNSGRGWPWKRVSKVTLGNVRMLDARARIHAATTAPDVELRATNKRSAVFGTDGTSSLAFTSPWDSSVHESPFLNRNTAANHRPLLQLSWEIEADNCAGPVKFTMDVAVTIQNRDARGPSKLMSMLSSTRISSRITNLFAVRLTPAMTKSHTDVWRLDTSETFVRGEEVLGSWKPRGLSLIRDYDQLSFQGRRAADVEAAKSILAALELTLPAPAFGLGVDKGERLARVVEMWQKTFGAKADVSLPCLCSYRALLM